MTAVPHPRDPVVGDAFGEGLLAALAGEPYRVVNERDDGHVDVDTSDYLGRVEDDPHWSWIEPRLGERVLDIGAGGGRASVPLEEAGVDVTALDVSPGALEVCRRRGVTSGRLATNWFGLLWLAPEELDTVAGAAGWELRDATDGMIYAAELGPAG
jgi:SAM-dependent methyltransferase